MHNVTFLSEVSLITQKAVISVWMITQTLFDKCKHTAHKTPVVLLSLVVWQTVEVMQPSLRAQPASPLSGSPALMSVASTGFKLMISGGLKDLRNFSKRARLNIESNPKLRIDLRTIVPPATTQVLMGS